MASESSEERTVSVNLPAELAEWLEEEARTRDVDRGTLLGQLLAAYRTTARLDGDIDADAVVSDAGWLPEEFDEQLAEALDDRLDDALSEELDEAFEERLDDALAERLQQEVRPVVVQELEDGDLVESRVEALLNTQLNQAMNSVQKQLGDRIEGVEGEFQEKLNDIRSRVVQVKKETDAKAPEDHTHPELARLDSLAQEVETLQSEFEELRDEYEATVPEQAETVDDLAGQLDTIQERLQTVAWVVSDLRDSHESGGGLEAVERIKRAAARADVERANCENCGEGVTLALLTDPKCPHCDATVTNVEPASGWFSNPKLLVASQLEAGDTDE
jgi:DNA repair exonuclease SbcCD ATPase subunit